MARPHRRLLLLFAVVPIALVAAAVLYMAAMSLLEGEERGFWQALEWAAETLTTTGYGADAEWRHPLMILFVILVQFAGVFFVFLVFPIYLIPTLEERFEARLPKAAPNLEGHVVIYGWGPSVYSLVSQLEAAGVSYVVIEERESVVRRLVDRGQEALCGSVDDGALDAASLLTARAFLANAGDSENAAAILAARQLGFEGDVLALVEEPSHLKPILLAGATASFTPRHILGTALAARASRKIIPSVSGVQRLGRHVEVREMRVRGSSPLAGKTLREAGVGARTGASIIGQWVGGNLDARPSADTRVEAEGILVAVGSPASLGRLSDLADGTVALPRSGAFVIAGYGEVGRKVVELLREAGEETRVVDLEAGPGVDLVGDILDPRVLAEADVSSAQAVVMAVEADSATLFATVILRDAAPEVPVIARVNQPENVERIYRAGADFALSISQVSGQMLARRLLGEEAVTVDPHLTVGRLRGEGLVGSNPATSGIRERTGCSVVAVERGEEVIVTFGPDFRFAPGDDVYVSGSSNDVARLSQFVAS